MERMDQAHAELLELAAYLGGRRSQLLQQWRAGLGQVPSLPDTGQWSEAQLLDHFPEVLEGVERILATWPDVPPGLWRHQLERARAHARYRWLQGFDIATIMQEWGCLDRVMLSALSEFADEAVASHPRMKEAHLLWATVLEQHLTESVAAFHQFDQAEAATRSQELAEAFRRLQVASPRSNEAIGAATQDMRSALAVAQTSAAVIGEGGLSDADRRELQQVMRESFATVNITLTNLWTLAQLEAGAEPLAPAALDATEMLDLTCTHLSATLAQFQIELKMDGPPTLPVESDAARLPLLVRSLAMTASEAAQRGQMLVQWGEDKRTPGRWFLNLAHTVDPDGRRMTSPTARALSDATRSAHRVERGSRAPISDEQRAPAPVSPLGSNGIHLAIAKRVCELLHASLEMESTFEGLQYRVTLPVAYPVEPVTSQNGPA